MEKNVANFKNETFDIKNEEKQSNYLSDSISKLENVQIDSSQNSERDIYSEYIDAINSKIEKQAIIIEVFKFDLKSNEKDKKGSIHNYTYSFIVRLDQEKWEISKTIPEILLFLVYLKESDFTFIPKLTNILEETIYKKLVSLSTLINNKYSSVINIEDIAIKLDFDPKYINLKEFTAFLVQSFKYFNFRLDLLSSEIFSHFFNYKMTVLSKKIPEKFVLFRTLSKINQFSYKEDNDYFVKNHFFSVKNNSLILHLEKKPNLTYSLTDFLGVNKYIGYFVSKVVVYQRVFDKEGNYFFTKILVKNYISKLVVNFNENTNVLYIFSKDEEISCYKIYCEEICTIIGSDNDNFEKDSFYEEFQNQSNLPEQIVSEELEKNNTESKSQKIQIKLKVLFLTKLEDTLLIKDLSDTAFYSDKILGFSYKGDLNIWQFDEIDNQISHVTSTYHLFTHFKGYGLINKVYINEDLIFVSTENKLIVIFKIVENKNELNINIFSKIITESIIRSFYFNDFTLLNNSTKFNSDNNILMSSKVLVVSENDKAIFCGIKNNQLENLGNFRYFSCYDEYNLNINNVKEKQESENYENDKNDLEVFFKNLKGFSISKNYIKIDLFNSVNSVLYYETFSKLLLIGLSNGTLMCYDLNIQELIYSQRISNFGLNKISIDKINGGLIVSDLDSTIFFISF
jgi:hypothetical protein